MKPAAAVFLAAAAGAAGLARAAPQNGLLDEWQGAATRGEMACTYAPSHSETVSRLARAMGGMGALHAAVAQMVELKPSARSGLLLAGMSDRVPPSLLAAMARPILVNIGLRVNAVSYYFELLCVSRNSGKDYLKVLDAAMESERRLGRQADIPVKAFTDPHARPAPQRTVQKLAVLVKPPMGDVYSSAFMVPGKSFSTPSPTP
jgi:hypothetical protein